MKTSPPLQIPARHSWSLIAATVALLGLFVSNVNAEVIHQIPPGPGESNWSTPWKPANVEGTPAFIDFESLAEQQVLGEVIAGVRFTTTQGQDWRVARFSSGNYNGKYPSGSYTSQGDASAWLGVSQGSGIIRFTQGKATYFSCLASTASGVTVDAYDENDNLVATSGWAARNTNSGTMDRVTVASSFRNIQYVTVHDSGNYWIIDCISTDAPGVGLALAVPSFKQYDPIWKNDEIVPGKTIGQIGCAMTSVAMVLASYGIETIDIGDPGIPDIQALTPATLNIWLKKNDGYVISRDPKKHGDLKWGKIDDLTDGKVKFAGGGGVHYQPVNSDLELRRPVLLMEPGHWVVARGKHTEDIADETKNYFLIRDPGHAIDSLNDPLYNKRWLGYRRYIPGDGIIRPALTIRMHSPAELLITDREGRGTGYDPTIGAILNEIPEASSFEDGPINNLETGAVATSGQKVLYLPITDSGPYQLTVIGTGLGEYEMDVEFRDAASHYTTAVIAGATFPGKIEVYHVVNSSMGPLVVTSRGSLKGGGTLVSGGNRVVLTANVSSDGSTPSGTLRFEFPKTGRKALSATINTATFQEGAANIEGTCTYGGMPNYKFTLLVESSVAGNSLSLQITSPSGSAVFDAEGAFNGNLRISLRPM